MKALFILSLTIVSLNVFAGEVGEDLKGECIYSSQSSKREDKKVEAPVSSESTKESSKAVSK